MTTADGSTHMTSTEVGAATHMTAAAKVATTATEMAAASTHVTATAVTTATSMSATAAAGHGQSRQTDRHRCGHEQLQDMTASHSVPHFLQHHAALLRHHMTASRLAHWSRRMR
jgi:hypothetical protein